MSTDPSTGFAYLKAFLRWRNHPEGAQVEIRPDAPEVEEQSLFRAFLAAGIVNANSATIAGVVRQKPQGWQRVGKPFEFKDSTISPVLQFRRADLTASIRIDPVLAREQGREISAEELAALLSQNGVTHGVDADLVGMLLKPNCATGWYDVAVGEPPENGTDSVIECRAHLPEGLPEHKDEGSVDFHDRGDLPEIAEGTAIYVRIPGKPAKEGVDLSGRPLPARKGIEVSLVPGTGMRFRDGDENVLEAAYDGYLLQGRDGKLHVGRVFEVKGDLNLSVGNIRYHGPVTIGGNVPAGFAIRAGGDVQVRGTVEGADIRTGSGKIQVLGGVFGARLEAPGDISVAFAHEATLESGAEVDGGKYLQHCQVRCASLRFSRSGMFVGGRVMASREIECEVLGTEAGTPTIVQLTDPEEEDARQDLEKIAAEEKKILPLRDLLEQKVVQLKARLSSGAQLLGRAREDAEESLKQYSAVVEKVHDLERRRTRDQEILAAERNRSGFVSVRREIHPGVEVHIFGRRFEIDSVRPPVRLVARDKEVEAAKI